MVINNVEKVDFVIPWVDGNDQEWVDRKNKYNNKTKADFNNSSMRYRDMGTLKYVLRSIEKNCPWYNKIHLITEGHYPDWLDIKHEKICLVTHEDIYFNKGHLPTFNSSSIEMNLANIPNLAEKFIYMNDDTLIIKSVDPERFFNNNLPVDFLSHGWLPRNKLFKQLRGMNSWACSLKNNIDLINQKFAPLRIKSPCLYHSSYSKKEKISNFVLSKIYKRFLWLEHWHHPVPYLKKTLEECYSEYRNEMMECSKNRFRADNDLTQYLYRYWRLAKEEFYPYKYNDGLVCKIESKKSIDSCLKEIDNYTFFCPNDSISEEVGKIELEYIKGTLKRELERLLPNKVSFEM